MDISEGAMSFLLFVLLLAAEPFPEMEEPFVEDVGTPIAAGPIAGPDDQVSATWDSVKPLRPSVVSPASAETKAPKEIQSITVRSPSATAAQPPPLSSARPLPQYPPIAGFLKASWGDPRERVASRYGDRPLLDRGEGRHMIQDQCEEHSATVIYQFSFEGLQSIVCLFREGVQAEIPDWALYHAVRTKLVARYGSPVGVNESTDREATQAALWQQAPGELTLSYEPQSHTVQLRAEKSARE
jgi:hypothetical protein